VVLTGATMAIPPLALALVLPLPAICFVAFAIGALAEVMMVQWTVQMATRIPADKLARVTSYDALGSMAAMPIGALAAGPLAAGIGVSATQFAAAAVIVVASAFTLIPRDIWTIRSDDMVGRAPVPAGSRGSGSRVPGSEVTSCDVAVDGDPTGAETVLGTGLVPGHTGAIASARAGADLG
jgi:hypothetical protein